MEETCVKAIFWVIIGVSWLFILYVIVDFFIDLKHEAHFDRRMILESLYRMEDLLDTSSIQILENSVQPNDENIGHVVKERSNISDVGQGNRPKFTCMYDRIMWDLENSPSSQQAGENAP